MIASVKSKWPKSVRLTSSSEFQKVRNQGKTAHTAVLRISCLIPQENPGVRIGLVTSRKVGSAVERNCIRRRFREIFRKLQISSDWWIVVTAKRGITSLKFSVLQEECLLLMRKLTILPPQQ